MINLLAFQHRGSCRDHDPELFFPVSDTTPVAAQQIEQAKAVCAGCPVLADCRAYALAHGPQGIWGGTTDQERRAVRARENRAAVATQTDTAREDGQDVEQVGDARPAAPPKLPSYQSARQSLTRARRALDLAEHSGDDSLISRAEQRVAAAERQFAAVRIRSASGAVA